MGNIIVDIKSYRYNRLHIVYQKYGLSILSGKNNEFDSTWISSKAFVKEVVLKQPLIGYKIGYSKEMKQCVLITLMIPHTARLVVPSMYFGNCKLRCSKAKVLDINPIVTQDLYIKVDEKYHIETASSLAGLIIFTGAIGCFGDDLKSIVYKHNEYVYPDRINTDKYTNCANGIHFFLTKQNAIDYLFELSPIENDLLHLNLRYDDMYDLNPYINVNEDVQFYEKERW